MGEGRACLGELEKRYPELLSMKMFFDEKEKGVLFKTDIDLSHVPETTEVLYILGLSLFIKGLSNWIKSHPACDIVFLENDLPLVFRLMEEGDDHIFAFENVHLKVQMPMQSQDEYFDSFMYEFPFDHVFVLDATKDEREFSEIREILLRKSVLENAIHNEMLYYPKLYRNLRENFKELLYGFDLSKWKNKFVNIPAIILGAGPSLAGEKEELKKMQDKAILFAGGSSIIALNALGQDPDLCFAFDPNYEEYIRLRHNFSHSSPMITGSRVHPDINRFFCGPRGYFSTGTGGLFEEWMEQKLNIKDENILKHLSKEALSVTTVEIATAIYLGCDPIILVGVDLSYKGKERYSSGVLPSQQLELEMGVKASDQIITKEGKSYVTKWLMERDTIDAMAQKFSDRSFYDGSCKGVTFQYIKQKHLSTMTDFKEIDKKSMIHEAVESSKFSFSQEEIFKNIEEMEKSLENCHKLIAMICDELTLHQVEETPKMIVLEYDLQEEVAYECLLKSSFHALSIRLKKQLQGSCKENISFQIKYKLYMQIDALIKESSYV